MATKRRLPSGLSCILARAPPQINKYFSLTVEVCSRSQPSHDQLRGVPSGPDAGGKGHEAMATNNTKIKQSTPRGGDVKFRTWFRHWRSGEIIRAEDYGHKAFPIRG